MIDTVATESPGHPAYRHEPKLAAMIRDRSCRISSRPAASSRINLRVTLDRLSAGEKV